jgi:hypothetical protein
LPKFFASSTEARVTYLRLPTHTGTKFSL